jgi:hypothetical protein
MKMYNHIKKNKYMGRHMPPHTIIIYSIFPIIRNMFMPIIDGSNTENSLTIAIASSNGNLNVRIVVPNTSIPG